MHVLQQDLSRSDSLLSAVNSVVGCTILHLAHVFNLTDPGSGLFFTARLRLWLVVTLMCSDAGVLVCDDVDEHALFTGFATVKVNLHTKIARRVITVNILITSTGLIY